MSERIVTLKQMLEAKESRVARQRQVLSVWQQPLISVTVVMPGAIKDCAETRYLLMQAREEITLLLQKSNLTPLWQWHENSVTGPEALYCVKENASLLKRMMTDLEDHHPLGRLWDIDVIDLAGVPVSRQLTGVSPRRCLLCDNVAHLCTRSRQHHTEALRNEITRRLYVFIQSDKCR